MRPSIYSADICERIPILFSEGASIVKVCHELGINRDTYYEWNRTHPDFHDACTAGQMASQIWWEEKGKSAIFGETERFAGSSWQFVMKNRFRQDYRDEEAVATSNTLIEKLLEKL